MTDVKIASAVLRSCIVVAERLASRPTANIQSIRELVQEALQSHQDLQTALGNAERMWTANIAELDQKKKILSTPKVSSSCILLKYAAISMLLV